MPELIANSNPHELVRVAGLIGFFLGITGFMFFSPDRADLNPPELPNSRTKFSFCLAVVGVLVMGATILEPHVRAFL